MSKQYLSQKQTDTAVSRALENTYCPLNAECTEAYDLLQECERWLELGLSEYLPEFAKGKALETHGKVAELLDRVLDRKNKRRRGKRKGVSAK